MGKLFNHSAVIAGLATCIALSSGSVALGVADLTDWVGENNMAGANNYAVISATSAGGTFAERQANASFLSDHTLTGGPFNWFSPLSMSGTIEFTGGFDPVLFFGWYNSNNLNERIGLGVADPDPAGTGIRWQTQSGNVASTTVNSQNITGSRTTSTFAPGTYAFNFVYDGLAHMTGDIGGVEFARNYALPDNTEINLDRFGFLQKSTVDDNEHTVDLTLSDINYTGDTQFTGMTESADFDGDGDIDGSDLLTWQRGLGLTGQTSNENGDADNSGVIDGGDLAVWNTQFSSVPLSVVASAVPEPASAALQLLALVAFVCRRSKR